MARRRRRDRFNIKQYLTSKNLLIAAIALVVVISIVLIVILQSSIYTAGKASISFSYDTQGVIIRNEKLYKTDVSSRTKLVTEEGANVARGDVIAEVYTSDYNQAVIDELNACEKKILDYLRNNLLKDVLNQDLDSLDQQIDELSAQIRTCIINGDTAEMTDYYSDLCTLMQQRRDFLRNQVNEDSHLAELYAREDELLVQVESWTKFSIAEEDGIVSYYFDGAEASLTPSNMKELTADELLNIQNGKSYYTLASSADAVPLYRLVKESDWYVAIVSNEPIKEFENSNTAFTVSFASGDADEILTAKVADYKEDAGKYIYYICFSGFNKNLLTPRFIELTISCEYIGLTVPKKAVKMVDGKTGVYIKDGKEMCFVEVEVLIEQDGMACIEPIDLTVNLGTECEVYV